VYANALLLVWWHVRPCGTRGRAVRRSAACCGRPARPAFDDARPTTAAPHRFRHTLHVATGATRHSPLRYHPKVCTSAAQNAHASPAFQGPSRTGSIFPCDACTRPSPTAKANSHAERCQHIAGCTTTCAPSAAPYRTDGTTTGPRRLSAAGTVDRDCTNVMPLYISDGWYLESSMRLTAIWA